MNRRDSPRVQERCGDAEGALDYLGFHYCVMGPGLEAASLLALVAVVLLNFYLLGETAEEYFCVVVRKLTVDLNLAPSTAGVTFLALGNGAPDVFASLAAFVGGDGKIGLGAIVSAGSFVSGFVVGSVAVAAAPFEVTSFEFLFRAETRRRRVFMDGLQSVAKMYMYVLCWEFLRKCRISQRLC